MLELRRRDAGVSLKSLRFWGPLFDCRRTDTSNHGRASLFKQEPRVRLCRPAGAAAPSGGESYTQ